MATQAKSQKDKHNHEVAKIKLEKDLTESELHSEVSLRDADIKALRMEMDSREKILNLQSSLKNAYFWLYCMLMIVRYGVSKGGMRMWRKIQTAFFDNPDYCKNPANRMLCELILDEFELMNGDNPLLLKEGNVDLHAPLQVSRVNLMSFR